MERGGQYTLCTEFSYLSSSIRYWLLQWCCGLIQFLRSIHSLFSLLYLLLIDNVELNFNKPKFAFSLETCGHGCPLSASKYCLSISPGDNNQPGKTNTLTLVVSESPPMIPVPPATPTSGLLKRRRSRLRLLIRYAQLAAIVSSVPPKTIGTLARPTASQE